MSGRIPADIAEQIEAEIVRAVGLHGEQFNLPDSVWCCIATEEMGEIAQGVLKEGFSKGDPLHTDEEIIQLGSVLIHWLTIRRARRLM